MHVGRSLDWLTFAECQTEWVWTHQLECYLTSTDPGSILVVACPLAQPPALQVATCAEGNPFEPAFMLTDFGLNQEGYCQIAVEPLSWGAIKSLF